MPHIAESVGDQVLVQEYDRDEHHEPLQHVVPCLSLVAAFELGCRFLSDPHADRRLSAIRRGCARNDVPVVRFVSLYYTSSEVISANLSDTYRDSLYQPPFLVAQHMQRGASSFVKDVYAAMITTPDYNVRVFTKCDLLGQFA